MAKVRSPNYPGFDLGNALRFARKAFDKDNRNKMSALALAKHLGHESMSGPASTKVAALRAFGLIDEVGDQVRISDDAVSAMMAPEGSIERKDTLKRLASKPALFNEISKEFLTPPSEDNLRYWLIKRGYAPDASEKASKVYLATEKLASQTTGEYTPPAIEEGSEDDATPPPPPPLIVKAGDYVQWTVNGVDQFKPPRRVIGMFPGGTRLQIYGSNTGVPVNEVTVVEPSPHAPSGGAVPRVDAGSAWGQGENQFNVLQAGDRLQITADVDLEGLQELKEMLIDYESILKRRATRRSKFTELGPRPGFLEGRPKSNLAEKLGSNLGGDSEESDT
jgi:hypothetical protein